MSTNTGMTHNACEEYPRVTCQCVTQYQNDFYKYQITPLYCMDNLSFSEPVTMQMYIPEHFLVPLSTQYHKLSSLVMCPPPHQKWIWWPLCASWLCWVAGQKRTIAEISWSNCKWTYFHSSVFDKRKKINFRDVHVTQNVQVYRTKMLYVVVVV